LKIKLRLSLLFAAAAAVLMTVGGAVFVHDLSVGLQGGVVSGLQARAQSIQQDLGSHSVVAPLLNRGTPSDIDEASQILVRREGRLVDLVRSGARPLLSVTQWEAARRGGTQLTRSGPHSEDTLLVWALPSAAEGGAVVAVASSTDTIDAATDRVEAALLIGGPILVVLAALAAWLIAAAALRPVERMRVQAANRSLSGLRAEPLDVSNSGDEISALGRTLNQMITAARTASERQSAFVTAAGHELRTPLANLKLELELAGRPGRTPAELIQSVTAAAEEVERLGRLAEGLLLLAGEDEGRPLVVFRPCDLAVVASDAVDGFTAVAEQGGVALEAHLPDQCWVEADPDRIRQVIDNLVDNALRFAPGGSTVDLGLEARAGVTELVVSDRGPGFDERFLPRAFDRFSVSSDSRTRTRGGGAGLGLAIVKSIVTAHGGAVEASNRAEGGGRVTARMPLAVAGRRRRAGRTEAPVPVKMAPVGRR
jgi:two-component system, OmpR family, sensor kinase